MDAGGTLKGSTGYGLEIARAGEGLVTRLPEKAADALVMNAIFLVVAYMVAGEAE